MLSFRLFVEHGYEVSVLDLFIYGEDVFKIQTK